MKYEIINGEEFVNGISRNDSQEWIGWKIIDSYKKKYGLFKECHDRCHELDYLYNKCFKKN